MYKIYVSEGGHKWEKTNIVTIIGRKGGYDAVVCEYCGMRGKRYSLSHVSVSETYNHEGVYTCCKAPRASKIRIIICGAVGRQFANAIPGSIHNVADPPKNENNLGGVWIMGIKEPIKLLYGEFEVIGNE